MTPFFLSFVLALQIWACQAESFVRQPNVPAWGAQALTLPSRFMWRPFELPKVIEALLTTYKRHYICDPPVEGRVLMVEGPTTLLEGLRAVNLSVLRITRKRLLRTDFDLVDIWPWPFDRGDVRMGLYFRKPRQSTVKQVINDVDRLCSVIERGGFFGSFDSLFIEALMNAHHFKRIDVAFHDFVFWQHQIKEGV